MNKIKDYSFYSRDYLVKTTIVLDESNGKPNNMWVDKNGEFHNRTMKSRVQDNHIEIYSIHNKGKSVVAERFVTDLMNKIYKYMISI